MGAHLWVSFKDHWVSRWPQITVAQVWNLQSGACSMRMVVYGGLVSSCRFLNQFIEITFTHVWDTWRANFPGTLTALMARGANASNGVGND